MIIDFTIDSCQNFLQQNYEILSIELLLKILFSLQLWLQYSNMRLYSSHKIVGIQLIIMGVKDDRDCDSGENHKGIKMKGRNEEDQ